MSAAQQLVNWWDNRQTPGFTGDWDLNRILDYHGPYATTSFERLRVNPIVVQIKGAFGAVQGVNVSVVFKKAMPLNASDDQQGASLDAEDPRMALLINVTGVEVN